MNIQVDLDEALVTRALELAGESDLSELVARGLEAVIRQYERVQASQDYFTSVIPRDVSLVDELIAERRAEAAKEAAEQAAEDAAYRQRYREARIAEYGADGLPPENV